MSQLSSSVSLPQIAYRGVPVVTTETLAQAYEVDAVSIRKNFSCNKERFTEGKHYYTLSGNDLREFKNRVTESNSVQIGKNSRSLTLWTERGAARHAKMLNSDRAWDVFELLEETFFAVKPNRKPLEKRKEKKALPPAQLSLPTPDYLDETPFLRFIEEIQSAHEEVRNILQPLVSNSFNLCLELGLELGKRSGMRSGSIKGMDPTRNLTDLLQHSIFSDLRQALIYPERHLADYANPGYALLGIVRQLNAR